MTTAESIWMLNAYAATLAAFLLIAGRIADIVSRAEKETASSERRPD